MEVLRRQMAFRSEQILALQMAASIPARAPLSPGRPLDTPTRTFMESRFGSGFGRVRARPVAGLVPPGDPSETEAERLSESVERAPAGPSSFDFSRIRIHTDTAAAESAKALDAVAYTAGNHIIFDTGRYRPETPEGRRLLAHELVHTVQQAGRSGVVQRQGTGGSSPIGANAIFPYPANSRLLVNLLLEETMLNRIGKYAQDPDTAMAVRILRASEGQIATVTTSTAELFEAVVPSVNLPEQGKTPAQTVKNVTLRFSRQPDGKFAFALVADTGAGPRTLFSQSDISAKQSGKDFELSPPSGPASGTVSPGSRAGQITVSGSAGPLEFEVLQLTRLPDAPPANQNEKKVVEEATRQAPSGPPALSAADRAVIAEATKQAEEKRLERRHQVTATAGAQVTRGKADPVLTASWRASFTPFVKAGDLVEIPVRVEIEYAPGESVLAAASTGVGLNIPTKVPVNVRLDVGVAAGAVRGAPAKEGEKGAYLPGFGPTVGGGVGIALDKKVRVEVNYEYLGNVVRNSPNAHTLTAGVGVRF
jgi:hypothetical protein